MTYNDPNVFGRRTGPLMKAPDASGSSELCPLAKLSGARLNRGPLFISPKGRDGWAAKIRPRAVRAVIASAAVSARVAVVWRYANDARLRLWEGHVLNVRTNSLVIQYENCPVPLPFPPVYPGICVSAVRIAPPRTADRRRHVRRSVLGQAAALAKQPIAQPEIRTKAKSGLRIATLNVTTLGLRDHDTLSIRACERVRALCSVMVEKDIELFFIQETRLCFSSYGCDSASLDIVTRTINIFGTRFFIYLQSADMRGQGGLAVISRSFLNCQRMSHRMMLVEFSLGNRLVTFLNVHAPTANCRQHQVEFHEQLHDAWSDVNSAFRVLIGDLNAPLQHCTGSEASCNASRDLRDLLMALDARSVHQTCPASRKWTFTFPNGGRKQLDHIIVCKRFCTAARAHRVFSPPFLTSHQTLMCTLRIKWRRTPPQRRPRYPWWQLRQPDLREDFVRRVRDYPVSTWHQLQDAALNAAQHIPPHTTARDELRLLDEHEELSLRRVFQSSLDPVRYRQLCTTVSERVEAAVLRECQSLEVDLHRAPQTAWRRLKDIIGNPRPALCPKGLSSRERLDHVRQYFQQMGGDHGGESDVTFLPAPVPNIIMDDGPITPEEVLAACAALPRGKAPGSDDIPVECIAALLKDDDLRSAIVAIINRVWETGEVEPSWQEVVQVPIPKKGDLRELKNWRPICLVNIIVKLMNKVIYNRIVPAVDSVLRDAQFGFRPHRSTVAAQLVLNEVLTKSRRANVPLYMGFVDFSKAFPSISFASIRAALRAFHVPTRLEAMIMAVYSHLRAFVRTPFGDTPPFPVATGTLQGDVLAPFLFVMVLDRVLCNALDQFTDGLVLKKRGTHSRQIRPLLLTDVDYADDIVLFAESAEQLERMLSRLASEAARVNLRLNVGPAKTAFMSLDCAAPSTLQVSGLPPIPRVHEYVYLGQVQRLASSADSLQSRVHLAWAATHKLSPLWSLPVSVATKLRLFDVLVYPVLMYSLVSLPLTTCQIQWADRQLTRMRCMAARIRRWHEDLPLNVRSLYPDAMRFPERVRLERARQLGHALRHSIILQQVTVWKTQDAWAQRRCTAYELCARDVHLTDGADILEAALDRTGWRAKLVRLSTDLCAEKTYVQVTNATWLSARRKAVTLEQLQFVEESHTLFPHFDGELHSCTSTQMGPRCNTRGTTRPNWQRAMALPLSTPKAW